MKDLLVKKKTIQAMTRIYCKNKHYNRREEYCPACQTFLRYAIDRLEKCPQKSKMNCRACHIHCYNPTMRKYVQGIMRHAGKHMIYRHPGLTFHYLLMKVIRKI